LKALVESDLGPDRFLRRLLNYKPMADARLQDINAFRR
jgi:hypothetical protein